MLLEQQLLISHLAALASTVWAGWFVWKKSAPVEGGGAAAKRGAASSVLYGAILGGAAGTIVGFIVPVIFPSAYPFLGPIAGTMQFGPLGLLAGAVGGFINYRGKTKKGVAKQEEMEGS